MHWLKRILIFVAASLSLVGHSQTMLQTTIEELETIREYFDVADFYSELPSAYSSFSKCRSRGFSTDQCSAAANFCAINNVPVGGIAGAYFSAFQLGQLFKTDCGSGECFQCCLSAQGCRTSFKGFPVVNCAPRFGDIRAAGMALVDANAVPGAACLFTSQTCDHLPACNLNATPSQLQVINQSPIHVIRSSRAEGRRARDFAEGALSDWSNYLDDFHTSAAGPSNNLRQQISSLETLANFVTARGSVGWRKNLPTSFPRDWSEPQFRLLNPDGAIAAEPSQYNGVRQLGVMRLLAGIPNLANRLAYVESRMWTADTTTQYLRTLRIDPDQALLEYVSPIALEILKRNSLVNDYRLLAIPLPDENIQQRRYNGSASAVPPSLSMSAQLADPRTVNLRVESSDAAASTIDPIAVMVLWGDGSANTTSIPAGQRTVVLSHSYVTAGRYQVAVLVQNDAGLTRIGTLPVQTQANSTGSPPTAIISEFQLVDLTTTIDAAGGNPFSMYYELEGWPNSATGYLLGVSKTLDVDLNRPVEFGTLAAWNPSAKALTALSIKPHRYGSGTLIGLRDVSFTLQSLRVGVFSTVDNRLRFHTIPITPEMVRLYPVGSANFTQLPANAPRINGRLKIPVQTQAVRYARIDIVIPAGTMSQMLQGPVTSNGWTGRNGVWDESKPDYAGPVCPGGQELSGNACVCRSPQVLVGGLCRTVYKPQSGWWWNQTENGRGFFIEQRGNNLFISGFLYDSDGKPDWFATQAAASPSNGAIGSMLRFKSGQTLTGNYVPPTPNGSYGELQLTFYGASQAILKWPSGEVPLTRYLFSSSNQQADPRTGWWWNPQESGRGYSIEIQGNTLFAAGYMYTADGIPIWYSTSGPMANSNLYTGVWQSFVNGQGMGMAYRAPQLLNGNVGNVSIEFRSATTADLVLPNGRRLAIQRFQF